MVHIREQIIVAQWAYDPAITSNQLVEYSPFISRICSRCHKHFHINAHTTAVDIYFQ